ncbi:MAG: NAD(P)/FAD-dependent oxidoreductase [Pannonibacter sp.]
MTAEHIETDVVIVGGGIIGLSAAFRLAEAGRKVVLVERDELANEASRGNAGAFAFSDILPLASPGILFKAPKWLLDPLGPLAIPPREALYLLPWLLRFFRASLPDRVEASAAAQGALNTLAARECDSLVASAGLGAFVRADGSLQLYESDAEFRASLEGWAWRERYGIAFEHLDQRGLAELQPGLSPQFIRATFVPGWKTVTDPRDYALAVARAAETLGVKVHRGEVIAITGGGDLQQVRLTGGATLSARHVVLAAGPWSRGLAASLGADVPLIAERGYNTTLPAGAFDLKRQLIFGGHGFVVTPLANGVRVGGASELARFSAPVNFRRSQHMLAKAARFMPGLRTEGGVEWMGSRPSMPDSLPVIGRSPRARNVILAFGHGHLGLTQSAATARLVTDLVLERQPPIDLSPFRPDRF